MAEMRANYGWMGIVACRGLSGPNLGIVDWVGTCILG